MPRVVAPVAQFNGGEISPLALARSDLKGFQACCQRFENFLPALVGAAVRRSGFHYEGAVKDHARRSWLKGFRFDDGRGYVFEFGHQVLRFWTEHGLLLSGGSPLELVTPFTESDLVDDDGVFRLQFARSSDVVWVFSGRYYPLRVERQSISLFGLASFGAGTNVWNQPAGDRRAFDDINADQSKTVYVSALAAPGSTATLTSVGFQFQPGDSGLFFMVEDRNANDVAAWEPAKAIAGAGEFRRVDSRCYSSVAAGTTGTKVPVHTVGSRQDGDPGVGWSFNDPGYGFLLLPSIGSPTNSVTATFITRLPPNVIGSGEATYKWAFASWRGTQHPSCGAVWRERLCVARGARLQVSVLGDFENFELRDAGVQQAYSAMDLVLPAAVLWLAGQKNGLLIGTSEGVFRLYEQTTQEVFGPLNYKLDQQSDEACSRVEPALAGDATLFADTTRRKLYASAYDIQGDGYDAVDQCKLADHVLADGGGLVQVAFQRFPDPVLWGVRADGQLVAFTFMRRESVFGWARVIVAGADFPSGIVESVAVCPDPLRESDEVTVVVRRTINGAQRRYVEYMHQRFYGREGIESARFLDSMLTLVTGGPITQITGLGHLEGATVRLVMDGQVKGLFVVSGGTITGVPSPPSGGATYHVGLEYVSRLVTVPLEVGSDLGSVVGRSTTVPEVWARLLETIGGYIGADGSDLVEMQHRPVDALMDTATSLFSGLYVEQVEQLPDPMAAVAIEQRQPLPMTVLGLYPRLIVKGR